ncbi:MAG TPA: Rrf2 family transcriptional regulator [Deltaproteobacteria bacterium]|nr:Rrf2 family transcriptional regulator [Deltaproteobacteria bacterium]HQI80977.1 Rrf2 family transcriptional regulator [Deltaproteobacteria bacterium]
MKLSTRSRYGVRLMLDLAIAHQGGKGQVFLKDIAGQEGISEKYLSLIMIPLKAAGLVTSTRGAHGGYSLARNPSQITLREIVDVLEGGTCLVDCVKNPDVCPRSGTCTSRDLWSALSGKISETLDSITLEDLAGKSREKGAAAGMYHI